MTAVGVLGVGTYLPPIVRTNDWWPRDVVAGWAERGAARVTRGDTAGANAMSDGVRRTLEAMAQYASDPFRGALERRVMPDSMTHYEMEAHAGREALQRAGIRPDQVDVILTQTPVPEYLVVNYACPTHRLLELPRNCVAIPTTTACNAFATHATLARALVASGQARHVLSIHSSALTRIGVSAEPDSAWWGDGAAAVVFGPVSDGRGITAVVNKTDGATCDAIVIGVQGRRWWEDGPSTMYHGNRDHTRAMLFGLVDRARDTITESMSAAELGPANLDFYASHQGTVWFTELTAELAGLARVPTLVTFPTLCNLTSVNIPMILALAEQKGMIRDGSNIVTFAGGVGETWSSICLRWGR